MQQYQRHTGSGGYQDVAKISMEEELQRTQDEARSLRQRCGDLEITLRRNHREQERLSKTLQNQTKLEEELSSLKTQLKQSNEKFQALVSIEGESVVLQRQVQLWETTFKDLVDEYLMNLKGSEHSGTAVSSATLPDGQNQSTFGNQKKLSTLSTNVHNVVKTLNFDEVLESSDHSFGYDGFHKPSGIKITPALVLNILSMTQKKCITLTKEVSDKMAILENIQRELRKVNDELKQKQHDCEELQAIRDKLQSEQQKTHQNSSLYTKEIEHLRGMMKSYEKELTLGKPELTAILQLHDQTLSELRIEFDKQRLQLSTLLVQSATHAPPPPPTAVNCSSNTSSGIQTTGTKAAVDMNTITATLEQTKMQLAKLKNEQYAITQAAVLDYSPALTKVLHLVQNPYLQKCQMNADLLQRYQQRMLTKDSLDSSIPVIALKASKLEIQRLREALHAAGQVPTNDSDALNTSVAPLNSSILDATNPQCFSTPHSAGHISHHNRPLSSTGAGTAGTTTNRGLASVGADSTKLNLRLKEMFRERITLFREAV